MIYFGLESHLKEQKINWLKAENRVEITVGALNGKSLGNETVKRKLPPLYGESDCLNIQRGERQRQINTDISLDNTFPFEEVIICVDGNVLDWRLATLQMSQRWPSRELD